MSVRWEDCAACARHTALNENGVCVRCARAEAEADLDPLPAKHKHASASTVDEGDRWRLICKCGADAMLSKVEGSVQSPWVLEDDPDDDEEQRPDSPHVCGKCGGVAPRWIGRCAHCKAWNH